MLTYFLYNYAPEVLDIASSFPSIPSGSGSTFCSEIPIVNHRIKVVKITSKVIVAFRNECAKESTDVNKTSIRELRGVVAVSRQSERGLK